jgi:hypothetical protein
MSQYCTEDFDELLIAVGMLLRKRMACTVLR